jgi:hypothetical protein
MNQRVLITAGAAGIGLAIAKAFATSALGCMLPTSTLGLCRTSRSSTRHHEALIQKGHPASRVEARGAMPVQRNKQFEHIGEQREEFAATGDPNVDTKK